jgi:ubiquinone/menaquinone biosynthesis C-methylase UbiE
MQKDIFLSGEGDAWVNRNLAALDKRDWHRQDLLFQELSQLALPAGSKVLEIGCSEGSRLTRLRDATQWECYGLDPSAKGVEIASSKGIHAVQGTADKLPWDNQHFDAVIFGFCLYLCDRSDLFTIAAEANRVLKNTGWLAILDFYSESMYQNAYSHYAGMKSYKMDYRSLFTWHPFYTCYSHKVVDHAQMDYTDEENNWMAVSILRKKEIS